MDRDRPSRQPGITIIVEALIAGGRVLANAVFVASEFAFASRATRR